MSSIRQSEGLSSATYGEGTSISTDILHPGARVALIRAAHARAGDKGDTSNICLIAWHPGLYPLLAEQITEEAVLRQFRHRRPARVTRYLLPLLHAMNFVLEEALDGGVNHALNLDSHGKALSFLLLEMPLEVPGASMPLLRGPFEPVPRRP